MNDNNKITIEGLKQFIKIESLLYIEVIDCERIESQETIVNDISDLAKKPNFRINVKVGNLNWREIYNWS